MEWNFESDRPIYIQLVEKMKIAIISGKYKLGERLPSVRDFAIEIKANPNTVQRAYSELEAEGLVITQRTNGKFVTEDIKLVNKMKEEIAKQNLMKFIDSMTQLGFSKDEIKEYLILNSGRGEK
jgi:GntR family transcriptional regulator